MWSSAATEQQREEKLFFFFFFKKINKLTTSIINTIANNKPKMSHEYIFKYIIIGKPCFHRGGKRKNRLQALGNREKIDIFFFSISPPPVFFFFFELLFLYLNGKRRRRALHPLFTLSLFDIRDISICLFWRRARDICFFQQHFFCFFFFFCFCFFFFFRVKPIQLFLAQVIS